MDITGRGRLEAGLSELAGEIAVDCPPYGNAPLRHRTGGGIARWFRTAPAQIRDRWGHYWPLLLAGAREVLEPADLDRLLHKPFQLYLVKPGGLFSNKRKFFVTFTHDEADTRRPPLLIAEFIGTELQHVQALY